MDKYKLEYEIKSRGLTQEEFCKAIGMSRSAFSRKMRGDTEFTRSEIEKIVQYLQLESPMGIFFADTVS